MNNEFCDGKLYLRDSIRCASCPAFFAEPVVICPHCHEPALIQIINCAIFRHGIRKFDGRQMDPHAPKDVCDRLVKDNAIYGCGKPFQIEVDSSNNLVAVVCDYI